MKKLCIDKISQLPLQSQKTLQRIKEGECSTWLSMIPTCDNHFLMSADVFRDSIALRYARNPVKMQGFCDGCSKPFDITHALDCKRGGLVGARHNESRDLNLDLIHLTGLTQTVKEPVLKEPGPDGLGGLRVDWGGSGILGVSEGGVVRYPHYKCWRSFLFNLKPWVIVQ